MKRIGYLFLGLCTVTAVAACETAQSSKLDAKLDDIVARLDKMEKDLQARPVGAARGQQPRQRMEPDPTKVYAVPIEGAPTKGPEHAKVTLVEAFEYACPFCERVNGTIEQLQKDYGNDLKIVYKHFVVHPDVATVPAQAACAAHKQGKHEAMSKLIWEKGFKAGRNLARDNMDKLASEAGLDMNRYKADIDGEECKKVIQQDQAQMSAVGVQGTPAFYINGRYLSGAQPIDNFKRIIDEELKKANERVAQGTKVEEYYKKFVIEQGLKKYER
ncbi:MAG TPA: DsbA family protein [Haliangium sp.]|nr:DsbA family protein [Haliangium sp.]